jgi:hypothetical protein
LNANKIKNKIQSQKKNYNNERERKNSIFYLDSEFFYYVISGAHFEAQHTAT